MADVATVFNGVQLGVENVPGTSVDADKILTALGIDPSIEVDFNTFKPMGTKFMSMSVPNREITRAALEGTPTYTEMVYPLSSVLGEASISADGSGYKWVFTVANSAPDNPVTFTVQVGNNDIAGVAREFSYGLVNSFGMTFGQQGLELRGEMIGRAMTAGATLFSPATSVELVPILGTQVSVYMDDTAAGLGGTQLGRPIRAEWRIENRFAPVYVLDASVDSFVGHVELAPTAYISLLLEGDAEGLALIDDMRAAQTKFIRIEAIGDAIGGGAFYKFRLDAAGKVDSIDRFRDEGGVYAFELRFATVYDGTWGKALNVEVTNDLSGL